MMILGAQVSARTPGLLRCWRIRQPSPALLRLHPHAGLFSSGWLAPISTGPAAVGPNDFCSSSSPELSRLRRPAQGNRGGFLVSAPPRSGCDRPLRTLPDAAAPYTETPAEIRPSGPRGSPPVSSHTETT